MDSKNAVGGMTKISGGREGGSQLRLTFLFNVNINVLLLDIKYGNTVKQINLWVDFEKKKRA